MKPALIATILLALLVYFAPRGNSQQPPADGEAKTSNQSSLSSDHSAAEATSTKQEPPGWYKTPEWILVIVGFVTAFVIGWQSWETRRAADAANRNISASMDERRARVEIIAEEVWLIPGGISHVEVHLSNGGPTIVSSIEGSAARLFLTSAPDIEPVYAECTDLGFVGTIADNSTSSQRRILLQPEGSLTTDQVSGVIEGKRFVHFYGFVRYRDVYRRLYRVRVHLRWAFGKDQVTQAPTQYWLRIGKPEDNSDKEEKPPHKCWMARINEALERLTNLADRN